VIEFKRGVYQMALQELSRFIHRQDNQRKPYHQKRRHQENKSEAVIETTTKVQMDIQVANEIVTPSTATALPKTES
jgi:hypothetical protein